MPAPAPIAFTTLRDVLRWSVSRFNEAQLSFGHGCANALDEAAYLILHTLHLPLDQLELFLDAKLIPEEITFLLRILKRRVDERIPSAYLTGQAWLQGHVFQVDERVIVPRSHLAGLILQQLHPWIIDPASIRYIADVCTGSGCLAILAALAFPEAKVDAIDLSAEALAVAHCNVAAYGLEDRIELRQSDLFQNMPKRRYDLIICNPPYVNDISMAALPAEYRHEPSMALAGGADGMLIVRRLLAQLPQRLSKGAGLLLEIGHESEHFLQAFPKLQPIWIPVDNTSQSVLWLNANS